MNIEWKLGKVDGSYNLLFRFYYSSKGLGYRHVAMFCSLWFLAVDDVAAGEFCVC